MATGKKQRPNHVLLREYLDQKNLSVRKFAELVGCSKSMVGACIKGTARPGLQLATRIEQQTRRKVLATRWTQSAA